jgi:protein lifeguard
MDNDVLLPYKNERYDNETRLGFIRKVMGILAAQMLVTVLIVLSVCLSSGLSEFLYNNIWLIYLCLGFYLVVLIMLMCFKRFARSVPVNYILLGVLTVSMSVIAAVITSCYDPYSVLIALGLTLAVTVSLTIYALTTKTDFTVCYGLMWALCFATTIVALLLIFNGTGGGLYYFYCWLCVIAYSIYLIVDIQLVAGGRRHKVDHEDYIIGALVLYIDIIMLFLKILKIVGKSK